MRTFIREHRRHRSLTIAALARRAAMSRQTIYTAEQDPAHIPSGSVMRRLAAALNVEVVDLFAPPSPATDSAP